MLFIDVILLLAVVHLCVYNVHNETAASHLYDWHTFGSARALILDFVSLVAMLFIHFHTFYPNDDRKHSKRNKKRRWYSRNSIDCLHG